MTDKRDSKRKPKKDERPKIKKETLSDLDDIKDKGEGVKGGGISNAGACAYGGSI